ncbi:MAG: RagB/SusD family nutrient uptake outer membrane protein [Bacteroidota bacterium]
MKKLLYIIFPLFILSCEGMLDEVPEDFVSRANYYQNEADAQGAINGVYSAFGPDFGGITYYLMVELHADFLNGRGSQQPISNFDQLLNAQNIGRAATNWATFYRCINRANVVIDNVSLIENIDAGVRDRIVAEGHFLRALAYFELVRGWGPVPLRVKENTDLSGLDAARAPESEIYDLIIQDLITAEASLPDDVGAETGKASVWAAKMLLAHVYLTTEQWSLAAQKADEVIQSGKYELVTVSKPDDFYNIFGVETSTEDIMSTHHSPTRGSSVPNYLHRANARPYNYSSGGVFAWLPDTVNNTFIGPAWDNNDLRKAFNLYRQYQDFDGNWVDLPSTIPILFKKFITTPDGISVPTIPIYRYSEAFLFYAEAAARANNGPTALALERLNMIKRRAYGYDPTVASPVDYPSGMTEDQFADTVLQERAYEFMIERRRWFDLKRTGKVKEAFAAIGKTFIDERLFWPIPEDEINNNALINQVDQNPGY